jgi:undecaprenyl diphosphate synthase
VYSFSTENWTREADEVNGLMRLLRDSIEEYRTEAIESNLRITTIGDLSRLSDDLNKSIAEIKEATKDNTGMTMVIALNYGGRDEIIRAVNKTVQNGVISEQDISDNLDTAGIPDPDLVIRTSGEQRMSNFLTWQTVYSELYFADKLFPDFKVNDLKRAIAEYQKRKRRYGG